MLERMQLGVSSTCCFTQSDTLLLSFFKLAKYFSCASFSKLVVDVGPLDVGLELLFDVMFPRKLNADLLSPPALGVVPLVLVPRDPNVGLLSPMLVAFKLGAGLKPPNEAKIFFFSTS